jgi:anthranilate phosphoribosyltransferase
MLAQTLAELIEKRSLSAEAMRAAMRAIMAGECHEAEVASFLTALRTKGESAEEIAAATAVLREFMVRLDCGNRDVLDTCGTGGDGQGTFNISTATALMAAACGVTVVKHGNRGVSSASGSADVFTALGVKIDAELPVVLRCLDEAGIAFCFAPRFHPAMRHVAPVRQRLRFRTIFNLMGPLANPAAAGYQLLGVGRLELLDLLAEVLARLGTKNAYLVCGNDGLDEVTLNGPTEVRHVRERTVRRLQWTPADFGLPACSINELRVENPAASADLIRAIFQGREGHAREVLLANAAAALLAAQRVNSLREGVQLARDALSKSKPLQVLDRLVQVSNSCPGGTP